MTDDTFTPNAAASGATHHATDDATLGAAPPAADAVYTPPWLCTATSPLAAILDAHVDAPVRPVALWPSGQHSDAVQRAGRYAPEAPRHPARLLPDVAARIIDQYSRPGQTVLGLFCGCGTSVVEAVYAGRDGLGIDNDRRWAAVTRANLTYAHEHGATGAWKVMRSDARFLPDVPRRKRGSVDLLIATPPARLTPIRPGTNPRTNQQLVDRLDNDLLTTLNACRSLLRPGGTVVFVTRLVRRAGQLLDLTYPIDFAATCAGLQMVDRIAALRIPLRDGHPRPSARHRPARRQRHRPGPPIVHDDVLVYQVPTDRGLWRRLGR